jgi:predicted transcriptional regulator
MPRTTPEAVRLSIVLPPELANKVDSLAEAGHMSINRLIVTLLDDSIRAYEQRKTQFLELADRFQKSTDPVEANALREELACKIFGS